MRKVGQIIDEPTRRGPWADPRDHRLAHAVHRHQTRRRADVGLSTAMANAHDLAEWLGIPPDGLYNFKPSVRPVPLEVHIAGFPGKHYCPRMATMNKPTYRAILNHSPDKPTLVFVSSRRQTRLTALDLIANCSADERDNQFVNRTTASSSRSSLRSATRRCAAPSPWRGHPPRGLAQRPQTVERLFVEQKHHGPRVHRDLAWGVNFPAHLVVIKGTEFLRRQAKRYVDFPVTDVLQMMGRAGRPQFDQQGIAVILVHEPKKTFYRKFLYEPFPVESCLQEQLHDHVNAEVVSGTIRSKQDAVDFLSWTYFYRRLTRNPAYYHLEEHTDEAIADFLSGLVEATIADLQNAGCVEVDEADGVTVRPSTLGRAVPLPQVYDGRALLRGGPRRRRGADRPATLLRVLCDASEFDELPVRHNEEHARRWRRSCRGPSTARSTRRTSRRTCSCRPTRAGGAPDERLRDRHQVGARPGAARPAGDCRRRRRRRLARDDGGRDALRADGHAGAVARRARPGRPAAHGRGGGARARRAASCRSSSCSRRRRTRCAGCCRAASRTESSRSSRRSYGRSRACASVRRRPRRSSPAARAPSSGTSRRSTPPRAARPSRRASRPKLAGWCSSWARRRRAARPQAGAL